jgi:hypothetical protein
MIPAKVAVISVTPGIVMKETVARPCEPGVLLMLATFVFEELQVTDVVKSCVLLSEKCPVAVNCRLTIFVERKIVAVAGVISIDSSAACVTASDVEPEKPPEEAVIVVEPMSTDVARPLEPDVLLIVAILVCDEFHVTEEERSCVELSVNVPMAMNCWFFPSTTLGFTGVTVIEESRAGVTVSVTGGLDVMLVNVARMVVVPMLTAVANPWEPAALLIVATPMLDEDHVATAVKFCVLESANVPVAVNCWVVPLAILALGGDNVIDDKVDELNVAIPDTPS